MEKSSKIHWCNWEKLGKSKATGGLGFRDLRLFNKALLAKQGWRLLTQTSSITAQIQKAKYFPLSNFLESNLGNRPSFIWRSIFGARELLKEGLIWRVGDGRSIKIWGDRWLPTPVTHAVQTPINSMEDTSMVEKLIDKEQSGWNSTLVRHIFSPDEAEVILNIPLSPIYPPNRIIWKSTKDGAFSVCSAYHLGVELQASNRGQSSYATQGNDIWKSLWSLHVSNPVKVSLWRACNNLLPTKLNLKHKRVVEDALCPICGREDEDTAHVLWSCPGAQDVWGGDASNFQKCDWDGNSFKHLLRYVLSKFEKENVELFAMVARGVWFRKNKWLFEAIFIHPNEVYKSAVVSLEEFRICNNNPLITDDRDVSETRGVQVSVAPTWQPPLTGTVKINWDASINERDGRIGVGLVARDAFGMVLGARCVSRCLRTDPLTAEAMAALFAVQFCIEVGFFDVVFEGDAQTVIKEIDSQPPHLSRIGHFIESIASVRQQCRNSNFVYVHRSINGAAHVLACEAAFSNVNETWLEDTLRSIAHIVTKESILRP